MSSKIYVTLLALLLLTTSCATMNKGQQGGLGGAAGGAILGQAIGHDTEATLLGAAIGGVLGYVIGNEMDKADQRRVYEAYEYTPDHRTSEWVNPNSGNEYAVTPTRTYKNTAGMDCREAEILTTIDGRAEKTVATACRENGRWVIR